MPSLGYLVPEFPGQTHIWMWREIVALRRQMAQDAKAAKEKAAVFSPPPAAAR